MKHFDYIIAGAGCSGRSLAVRLMPYLKATNKKLLLVDREHKTSNDKTWCFWEKNQDIFEDIVYKRWDKISFSSKLLNRKFAIAPYQYKMIRAIDFYTYTDELIAKHTQITSTYGHVENLYNEKEQACIVVNGEVFSCDYLFSSILQPIVKNPARYQYFLQHFEGWVVKTDRPVFDPECATLMDFNTDQQAGTTFFYTLPFDRHHALIEYTIFSKQELDRAAYTKALQQYIGAQLPHEQYTVQAQESGVIPMTDHPLKRHQGRIIYLGTAGGFTKGSTGYTFRFIQQHTEAIVSKLTTAGNPYVTASSASRFQLYDATLLHLLDSGRLSGEEIFSRMFKKNNPVQVLKFLDNKTSLMEELKIFSTLQKVEFSRALWNRTMKLTGLSRPGKA